MRKELPLKHPRQLFATQINNFVVSTVRLPVGVTYESMVFSCNDDGEVDNYMDLACIKAKNKEEAKTTHEALILEFKNANNA